MRGKLVSWVVWLGLTWNIPAYAGKTKVQDAEAKLQSGTSPRMRGKPADDFHRLSSGKEHPRVCGENTPANEHGFDLRRNIPAYAGKTATHQLSESAETEHPRVCGENPQSSPRLLAKAGTSPRMRGKQVDTWLTTTLNGNIPAYAGKTGQLGGMAGANLEHPRVCGENFFYVDTTK